MALWPGHYILRSPEPYGLGQREREKGCHCGLGRPLPVVRGTDPARFGRRLPLEAVGAVEVATEGSALGRGRWQLADSMP